MGGARPALSFERIYRGCVILCAALMIGFGGAELRAQAAPATKPLAPVAKKHAAPAQPLIATQRKAPSRLAAHTQTARLKKVARASKAALRIMPMVGAGGGRNIRDLRFMKGADLAITQPSLLARMRQSGEIGAIDDKIVYLAKLFNEEMHLVVRADAGVASIQHLAGRTVNLGEAGSGTQSIARDVFTRLGIAVREVNMTERAAIEGLRTGDIDATIVIGGKPVPAVALMAAGFRLLPVPFVKQLREDFLPAILSNEDYPGLIEPGRRVETLAVGSVLIAYNWPRDSDRYQKIEKFVEAFFPRLAKLQAPPHHPKWREVNVAATLPGWTRFGAAEDWLRDHREPSAAAREQFEQFVSTRQARAGTAEERERLFQDFMQWQQARERR